MSARQRVLLRWVLRHTLLAGSATITDGGAHRRRRAADYGRATPSLRQRRPTSPRSEGCQPPWHSHLDCRCVLILIVARHTTPLEYVYVRAFSRQGLPRRLPDMTTAPHWDLRRRDFHPQVQQIASLHSPISGPQAPTGGAPGPVTRWVRTRFVAGGRWQVAEKTSQSMAHWATTGRSTWIRNWWLTSLSMSSSPTAATATATMALSSK